MLRKKADVAFLLGNAIELPLPGNLVDYVIIDPPHIR